MSKKLYESIIGLEIHIELATASKMFCRCSADHFGIKPNTHTCPTCLGLPGALPYVNKQALEYTAKLAFALGANVHKDFKFDRKHYFYPDLPKGYQISQYDMPISTKGEFKLPNGKSIRLRRIHLEEDTGKMVHSTIDGKKLSLVDFNRSGVPLVEMVTEPDFRNNDEVLDFLREIQKIVRYIDISGADMEKGSMRLEANISAREVGGKNLPKYKVELKNINSFRYLQKAISYEESRQIALLDKGKNIIQETRGYDESKQSTFSQRVKEAEEEYRYFPEPDIPPISLEQKELKKIKDSLPELPSDKRKRLKELGMPENYIEIIVSDVERVEYFENAVKLGRKRDLKPSKIADAIVNLKLDRKYKDPADLVKKLSELQSLRFASEKDHEDVVVEVVKKETSAVQDYKSGNHNVIGFLIGAAQKKLGGKGDPKIIRKLLLDKLR